uniref:MATH domain-containing protein n=1 Tax=Calcidiscus leptoporus TaxID=127549 RepID=A0A7S0JII2_9EUKA|mmetsp:Transcript_5995/g.13901  ORF Transcript_5995/g.13901 Transcript_5995/m.13901 type:complete len:145 (+) Transcript_5995:549-983(+)
MPASLSYVWNIPHFSSLSCLSMYSPAFPIRAHMWKIYVYPNGNNNSGRQISIYLDSGITDNNDLPCTFKLAVVNYKKGLAPTEPSVDASINWRETIVKESDHVFTKRAKDWGFREFMPLEKLRDPQAGFLNDDAITVGVLLELA